MSKDANKTSGATQVELSAPGNKPTCGLIMPISGIGDCSAEHWIEVRSIISEAVIDAGFNCSMVSEADEVGIIQKRIVRNLYSNDIVVCDVSQKNPNVMFELGMRLAFDKPAIIVKDDKTDYTFDMGVVEHLDYPRDLRFRRVLDFKAKLTDKLMKTHKESLSNPNYSTFLKSFGQFNVATIETKEVSKEQIILDSLEELKAEVVRLRAQGIKPQVVLRRAEETRVARANAIREIKNRYDNMLKSVGSDSPMPDDVFIDSLPDTVVWEFSKDELKRIVDEYSVPF